MQVTVVTPTGNSAPEAGVQVAMPTVDTAGGYVTVAPRADVAVVETLAGGVTTGAGGRLTVMVKVPVAVWA